MLKNKTKNISKLKKLTTPPKKRKKKKLTAGGWEKMRLKELGR